MYTPFLFVHSYLRWLVLAAALVVLVRAIGGLTARRPWQGADQSAARWFIMSLDVQFLIGLIIYAFLSPFTMEAWSDMRATMRNAPLRFIAVEHVTGMLIGIALAHVGQGRIRKTPDPVRKHRVALVFFGLSLVAILVSIPWPFVPAGRALFRGFGGG